MNILNKPIGSTYDCKDIDDSETESCDLRKRRYLPNRSLEDASGKRHYVIPTVWDKHH